MFFTVGMFLAIFCFMRYMGDAVFYVALIGATAGALFANSIAKSLCEKVLQGFVLEKTDQNNKIEEYGFDFELSQIFPHSFDEILFFTYLFAGIMLKLIMQGKLQTGFYVLVAFVVFTIDIIFFIKCLSVAEKYGWALYMYESLRSFPINITCVVVILVLQAFLGWIGILLGAFFTAKRLFII